MKMKKQKILMLLAGAFSVWGAQAVQQPNIIFIEVDDLNYKFAGQLGKGYARAPHMEALAVNGVYFENAMCQGMMCGPSRNSMVSGMLPHSMGFYRNGQMKSLPDGVWTFPNALQEAGYFTSYVGKSHIRPYGGKENMSEGMGFDHVQSTAGRAVLQSSLKRGKELAGDWYYDYLKENDLLDKFADECGHPTTLSEDEYLDGFFTRASIDFLNGYTQDKPLFMWLNYSLPHGPHDVNQRYLDQYEASEMPGIQEAAFTPPEKLVKDTRLSKGDEATRKTQSEYCAAVTYLDDQIGRLIAVLEQKKMMENTVIVFFSDHGIMMGDHNRLHKGTLFRQVTNPALVISSPKVFRKGVKESAPVELLDLIPTVLELAGHPELDGRDIKEGESLMPLLTGNGSFERPYSFCEVESYVAVSDGSYRLIKGEGNVLLFDEVNDPDNLEDISSMHPEKVAELSKAVDEWLDRTGPVLPPGGLN